MLFPKPEKPWRATLCPVREIFVQPSNTHATHQYKFLHQDKQHFPEAIGGGRVVALLYDLPWYFFFKGESEEVTSKEFVKRDEAGGGET